MHWCYRGEFRILHGNGPGLMEVIFPANHHDVLSYFIEEETDFFSRSSLYYCILCCTKKVINIFGALPLEM